jgi:hypothetical protein
VLRIRDVYPGSDYIPSRIPDPNCFHLGSQIRIKELKYFNPKKWFPSSRKYDPNFLSRIPDFLPIPDPGSRGPKDTRSRIRIRNTGDRTAEESQRTEMSSLNIKTCQLVVEGRCGGANSTKLPTANMNP